MSACLCPHISFEMLIMVTCFLELYCEHNAIGGHTSAAFYQWKNARPTD